MASAKTTATEVEAVEGASTTTMTATPRRTPAPGRYGPYNTPILEPSSAIRKIVAENCSMTAGTAAVMLQIANKPVGLGVAAHSDFTNRPVERARRSLVYIYGMAFGTEEERRAISDATNRAHSRVKSERAARGKTDASGDGDAAAGGSGSDSGATKAASWYDADDPELQLWVAATIYWSLVVSYEAVFGPLPDGEADQVYAEFSVMATGLRVRADIWPRDRAAFREYWDRMVEGLEVTDEARHVARQVLWPKGAKLPWGLWAYAKLTGPANRIVTTELLPERVRNELGLQSTAYTRYMYWLMSSYNKAVYPLLPDAVRHFGKNHFMKDFRSRLARGARL